MFKFCSRKTDPPIIECNQEMFIKCQEAFRIRQKLDNAAHKSEEIPNDLSSPCGYDREYMKVYLGILRNKFRQKYEEKCREGRHYLVFF